jgi:NADH:ubiquinone oxidoreductase subunit 2 (subunit N)
MSNFKFMLAISTIALIGYSLINNVALTAADVTGMAIIVPCLTAAIYRAFKVFGL